MEFLYLLEKIRNPFLDFLMSTITHLGEETVFLVVAIFVFWCVNKREGYYILITGLVGTAVNQFAKMLFRIPRPWVIDDKFTIVESAREEATGYSFPSGHTQNVSGTLGSVAAFNRKRWLTVTLTAIILTVAFSRMYLGVHTPKDVLFSLGFALVLVVCLRPFFVNEERYEKYMPYIVIVSAAIAAAFTVYAFTLSPLGFDPHNYYSAKKNASTLTGCLIGLIVVYFLDRKYIKFDTGARWYAQVIKLVIGLLVVLGIKSGLSSPLVALFGNEFVARGVRYFLIVIFAGVLYPLSFKLYAKLRIPFLDRLTKNKE